MNISEEWEYYLQELKSWIEEIHRQSTPRYRITEDPDELGYWLEEIEDE